MKLLKEKRSTEFEIHLKGYAGAYYLRNIGKETDKTLEECFGKVMEYFNDSIDMAYEEGKKNEHKRCVDLLDNDHTQCVVKESCIGYQNAQSDLVNNPPTSLT